MKRIAFVVALLSCASLQAQEPQSPDQQIQALRQALAQKTAALGAANAELGPLQKMQAGFMDGTYATVADVVKQIVVKVEQGNPGQTLDLQTGKLVAKPDSPKAEAVTPKPKPAPKAANTSSRSAPNGIAIAPGAVVSNPVVNNGPAPAADAKEKP